MLQPVRRRTWAPSGKTPIQNAYDRHDRLSVMATLTLSPQRQRLGYYFSIWSHNIATEDVVWFLTQMHRHFRRRTIVVWDRWQVHRSAARYFEKHHPTWFQFEWLPAYAPELNPVEPSWGHTKYADLANFIPDAVDQLQTSVQESLQRKHERKELLRSFFAFAELPL
jgi:transposase